MRFNKKKKPGNHKINHGLVNNYRGFLWILPSLLGVLIFYLLPYGDVVRRSFLGAVDNQFTGIKNYQTIFENTAFLLAVKNTLRFTFFCIPVLILAALLCAVILYRSKFGGVIKSAFLMPMALPAVSVALMWRLLFHSQGVMNQWLSCLGIAGKDWMNTEHAFWILVVSYIWKNLGYDIVLWMAGLAGISENIYEAARVDGADERQCFFYITLPNLKPSLYTITVLSFLNSFKVFREAYLVAGDYPHESIYMMQHLFNNWFRSFSFDKMAAAAVIESIVLLGMILLLQKAWDSGDGY
ncbi:MAG: sugar ABC transporter permease [Lachnospiraceae bacterium]|nr:sugar ABC transporter permease [Lachnospiraceae bacterium]